MDEDSILTFDQLETICRLCLSDEGPMISLSSENFGFRKSYLRQIRQGPTSELCHKIFFLTTLQVSCDKMYFPTQICQKCNDLLQQFFVFKSRCLKNDSKIRDVLDNKERADANKLMILNQSSTSTSKLQFSDRASTSLVEYSNNKPPLEVTYENNSKSTESQARIQKISKKQNRAQYLFCETNNDGYDEVLPNTSQDPLVTDSVTNSVTNSPHSQPDERCVYIKQEIRDNNESSITVSENPSPSMKKAASGVKKKASGVQKKASKVPKKASGAQRKASGMRLNKEKPFKREKNMKSTESPACSACNQTFKKQNLLDKHFNICLARDLSCQYCNQIFKSQKLLDKHVHNKHTDKSDFLCYFCGLVFNNSYKLLTHIRTHMPMDKVYNCDKCSKNFRKRQALINHLRTAHSESTYMCNLCGSQLSSLPGLKLHIRTIHTHRKVDRVLKCPLCPKMFARQQYVVRHMRSHTGETPYNCKYCDRSFTLRWNHIQHERLHTGEKRYKCEICNKCFTHNVSKKNHMKYHKDVPGVNYVAPIKRKKVETSK